MNRIKIALVCLTISGSLFGCYTPRGAFTEVDETAVTDDSSYTIAPGDTISVRVFQQEAMSAKVKVRGDGKVSLPLINDVPASGKSPAVLAGELQVQLKAFINNPVVTVSLEESRPVVVSVVGEVVRPGVVTLEAGAGVLQALAASGGLTDFAHRDGVFVLRKLSSSPTPKRLRFTWEILSRGEGPASRFTLMPGDVVVAE